MSMHMHMHMHMCMYMRMYMSSQGSLASRAASLYEQVLQRELGVKGSSITDIIEAACGELNVSGYGLSLQDKAKACIRALRA